MNKECEKTLQYIKNSYVEAGQAGPSGASENGSTKSNSVDSIVGKPPLPPGASNPSANGTLSNGGGMIQPKTASIRARPTSSRITASEMHQVFSDKNLKCGTWNGPGPHKIYTSVAEMKRSKVLK
jgi:hypothetical protein